MKNRFFLFALLISASAFAKETPQLDGAFKGKVVVADTGSEGVGGGDPLAIEFYDYLSKIVKFLEVNPTIVPEMSRSRARSIAKELEQSLNQVTTSKIQIVEYRPKDQFGVRKAAVFDPLTVQIQVHRLSWQSSNDEDRVMLASMELEGLLGIHQNRYTKAKDEIAVFYPEILKPRASQLVKAAEVSPTSGIYFSPGSPWCPIKIYGVNGGDSIWVENTSAAGVQCNDPAGGYTAARIGSASFENDVNSPSLSATELKQCPELRDPAKAICTDLVYDQAGKLIARAGDIISNQTTIEVVGSRSIIFWQKYVLLRGTVVVNNGGSGYRFRMQLQGHK